MSESHIERHASGAVSFVGPEAVAIYRATVVASALRLYAKARIRVNRAYTPTAMLAVASEVTGRTFKRGQYLEAANALDEWRAQQSVPVITP